MKQMPHTRRRTLTALASALFVVNLFALTFALRSAFVPGADVSSAQFAGSAQATENAATSSSPILP